MQRNKAWRRLQRKRKINKVESWLRDINRRYSYYKSIEEQMNDAKRDAPRRASAGACGCYMCGNPRKYFHERTIKELIHETSHKINVHTV